MYHNRLRSFEFYDLLKRMGIDVLWQKEGSDNRALAAIIQGFPLDQRFAGHLPEELTVSHLNIL
jgi:hypothetical protein